MCCVIKPLKVQYSLWSSGTFFSSFVRNEGWWQCRTQVGSRVHSPDCMTPRTSQSFAGFNVHELGTLCKLKAGGGRGSQGPVPWPELFQIQNPEIVGNSAWKCRVVGGPQFALKWRGVTASNAFRGPRLAGGGAWQCAQQWQWQENSGSQKLRTGSEHHQIPEPFAVKIA